MRMTRVLVVDDEPQILRALRINLRARSYEVDTAPDGATALRIAAGHPPDLVVLDLGLPDMDGVEVIEGLRGWTTKPAWATASASPIPAQHSDNAAIRPASVDMRLDMYYGKYRCHHVANRRTELCCAPSCWAPARSVATCC
jgi:CheY-like chemotaxis protein